MRTRHRVPQILQLTQTECGLCCAQMLLSYYGIKESGFALRRKLDAGRDGANINDIADVFRERGFQVTLYRANLTGLKRIDGPFIAFWENYHFVVVERITDAQVILNDPATGRRRLSHEEFVDSFSGIALVVRPGEHIDRSTEPRRSPWRYFLAPMLRSKSYIGAIVVVSVLLYLVTIGAPHLTRLALDTQLEPGSASVGLVFFLALAGGALVYLILNVARVQLVTRLTVRTGEELMEGTFGHLLKLPYKYFSTRAPGELLYRLSSINGVRDLLSGQLIGGVLDVGMLCFLVAYMALTSLELTLLVLGLFGVVVAVLLTNRRAVSEAIQNEMTELSKSQSMQLEAIVSIVALKLSGSEEHFFRRWQRTYQRSLSRMAHRSILQGHISSVVSVIQVTAPLLVLFYGLRLFATGSASVGTVVAFQGIASMFFGLASSIFGSFTQFLLAGSYLDRLDDIIRTDPEPARADGLTARLRGDVSVRGLQFAYASKSADVLDGISFEVQAGQKVAVVGASGCGKSTLGKLLTGLYEPTGGAVCFDGRPLGDYRRSSFYQAVGYVPQEISLENKSILDNIRMGQDGIGPDDVARAARAARIHEEIIRMPMGYQTLVSEFGSNLSGGQRQRLALARAMVKDPRILVLDEATSSLDLRNENLISEHLSRQSCTRIVIAHRLTTVLDADLILVLDAGRIVERGTHDELIAVDGPYRSLFESQMSAAF